MTDQMPTSPSPAVHIGQIIKDELVRQRYSAAWLAEHLFCDRTNIYKIFHKSSLDTELLFKISAVLNHDFFRYYSHQLKQTDMTACEASSHDAEE